MSTTTLRNQFVVGIVVVSLFAIVTIPGAVAAQDTSNNGTAVTNGTTVANGTAATNETMMTNATLTADPPTAGGASNHTVTITLGDAVAGNLTGVTVNYTGTNVSTRYTPGNASRVTIANRSIPTPDNVTVGATNFVEPTFPVENDFSFDMNQSLQPEAGDNLTLFYQVRHPSSAGNYTVDIVLNPASDAVSLTANLTITPNETTPTAAGNGTTGGASTPQTTTGGVTTQETTTGGATTQQPSIGETTTRETTAAQTTATSSNSGTTTSSGNGPGFTVFAGLVGLLALGLLVLRRN